MTKIASVKTKNSNKALWFDANDLDLNVNDKVVVETARGTEFGTISEPVFEATDKQLKSLKSKLQSVKRIAKEVDIKRAEEMEKRSKEAFSKFKELAEKYNKDMVPVSVEYLLDGKKAVFYFCAEERQDFRELVKQLASELKIRVDMHQIGPREKAALIGGIGHCGQPLCCARLGACQMHVSIKMAKSQGLSLNPENISGCCGKLMCCLNYEFEEYEEFSKKAPKLKAKISTPEGMAVVTDVNMLKKNIQLRYGEPTKYIRVPVDCMTKEKRDNNPVVRPNTVPAKAWEECLAQQNEANSISVLDFSTSVSSNDKLNDGSVNELPKSRRRKSVKINSQSNDRSQNNNKHKHNKNNNRRKRRNNNEGNYENQNTRRRRSRTINSGSDTNKNNNNQNINSNKSTMRPGQHSSGLRK